MKRVLITGGNKGIGLATVAALLAQDENVSILLGSRDAGRGQEAIDSLCRENPHWRDRLELLEIDVANPDSVTSARNTVIARHGEHPAPLYGIVNNAGIGLGSGDMQAVLEVNLLGVKRVCDAFLPLLQNAGRIVNVSSASGPKFVSGCSPERQAFLQDDSLNWSAIEALVEEVMTAPDDAAHMRRLGLEEDNPYGFSKACVSLYTMLLANDYPDLYINACTPGYIETDLTRPQAEKRGVSPADLGMKSPEHGTVSILFLLLGEPRGTGHYYGSDAKRSPLDRYRAPGSPEFCP